MAASQEPQMALQTSIKSLISSKPVYVFSKSYCPFCVSAKNLIRQLGCDFGVIELDERGIDKFSGREVQNELLKMTGQRTVPNIFIGGKHVGGCDEVQKLHAQGKLASMVEAAK